MDIPKKARAWALLAYDDLTLSYLVIMLKQKHLSGYISPLHCPSMNPVSDDSDLEKKNHYHILIVMPRGETLSFAFINRIRESLDLPLPEPVASITGYARYLIHMDDLDKQQIFYGSKVETFGNPLSYENIIMQKEDILDTLLGLIVSDNIKSFQLFVNTAYNINPDYLPYIIKHAYFFKTFINDK